MKQLNLGYLAGLIDGEGTIGAYYDKNSLSPRVRINVVNTDPKMIKWIKETFQRGYIYRRRFRGHNWKDCYTWILNPSRKDKQFIESLIPILITKKKQMELVLEYVNTLNNHGESTSKAVKKRRKQIHLELKKLNNYRAATETKRSGRQKSRKQ